MISVCDGQASQILRARLRAQTKGCLAQQRRRGGHKKGLRESSWGGFDLQASGI